MLIQELLQIAESAKAAKRYIITKDRDGKTPMSSEGTLEELINNFSYTLETGHSYQHEKGNKKINKNPRTIADLVKNLNNAVNNAAANGYSGTSFTFKEAPGAVQELQVNEGVFIVKNKDGKEKRFKDLNSAEAKAWKSSTTAKKIKKPTAEKYSQEWWEDKEFDVEVVPWTRIDMDEILSKTIEKTVKDLWGASSYDILGPGKAQTKIVDGVNCASLVIRVMVLHSKDDDLGLDDDVEETYKITFTRNPKSPKKFTANI